MAMQVNQALMNVNPLNVKDSRWLTLEVCREYTRNKCVRTDTECKFAHPPPHVEVQNGRVTCCFDSIKGKCQRKDPPCKYLHPPQHLKEQLLQNGRNNLIIKNLQCQALNQSALGVMANQYPIVGSKSIPMAALPSQYLTNTPMYTASPQVTPAIYPYITQQQPLDLAQMQALGMVNNNMVATNPVTTTAPLTPMVPNNANTIPSTTTTPKLARTDRLEPSNVSSASSSGSESGSWNGTPTYPVDPINGNVLYGNTANMYPPAPPGGVEVWAAAQVASKKRARDPAEDFILMTQNLPSVKRVAVPDKTGMVPMYPGQQAQINATNAANAAYMQQMAILSTTPANPYPFPSHPPGMQRF